MGGLFGGLLEIFNSIGLIFYSLLIGGRRAEHPKLSFLRVITGGALIGIIVSCIVCLIESDNWFAHPTSNTSPVLIALGAGVFSGILIGGFIALVLFGIADYIQQEEAKEIREAEAEAKRQAEEEKRRRVAQVRREKLRDDLIAQGVDPVEAEYRAEKEVPEPSGGGCFIATAVFDSPSAPEVMILRQWRDDFLMPHEVGKLFIRIYYLISPHFVRPIQRNIWIKSRLKKSLQYLIVVIKQHSNTESNKR